MELRNSVWNELCTTVGYHCTTTKMNAHFVPRFFICLQAVNTQRVLLLARMLVPPQDFSLSEHFTPAFSVTCIGDIFVHLSTCHLSACYILLAEEMTNK